MSARSKAKHKPKAPVRERRGNLSFDALQGVDLDSFARTRESACNAGCGIGKGWYLCPVCRSEVACKPSDRRWVAQHIRGGLDELRECGARIDSIDAIERMAFSMLLGICHDCASQLHARGYLGDEPPKPDEQDTAA